MAKSQADRKHTVPRDTKLARARGLAGWASLKGVSFPSVVDSHSTSTPGANPIDGLRAALAGRYDIERELGRGGMGTVFLAEDRKHRRRVAIKVLRPEVRTPVGAERFLREIEIAASMSHPHILPLHDSGQANGLLYYVMPHVEGESLRDRLTREGRLPVDEAVRIARQVASALAYAHARGIVHRDIKPENILLSTGMALVSDFGIARAITAAADSPQLSTAGIVIGTPAYMSPEQASGVHELDGRSDVYSLGCVLYEMLAGQSPHAGPSAQAVIARRLSEPLPNLHTVPDVPEGVVHVVTKALAMAPADRFTTAEQFGLALETVGARNGPRGSRRVVAALAASVLAVALVAGGVLALAPRSKIALVVTLLTRKPAKLDAARLLVAPFDNETGDSNLANLGDMAADWITRGLSRTGLVEVVDGRTAWVTSRIVEKTPRMFRTSNPARALAEETGAGTVVWGTYYRDRDSLRFQAQITDVATGRVIRAIQPANGRLSAPTEVIDRLRQHVVASLAVIADTANAGWAAGDEPPSYEAYQETVRGVWSYMRGDSADAFSHLRAAAALDSSYITPLVVLAEAYDVLRQWDQVDTLVRRAERYRARFVPPERAWLDLLHADLRGDRLASLQGARELLRLSPGSPEYAALVALTAVYQNRPREALETLSRVDPQRGLLLSPLGSWYWVHLADARHELGSYAAELEDTRRGVHQFPEALFPAYCELRALAALGRLDELDRRRRAFVSSQDRPALINRLQLSIARELRAHGYRAQAIRLADHLGPDVQSERGDTIVPRSAADRTTDRVVWAWSLYLAERWDEAHTVFTALAGQDSSNVGYQVALGVVAARRGDRSEAERIAMKLASMRRPHLFGINTYGRAKIASLLGEREGAVGLLRDALAQGLRGWSFLGDVDIHTDMDFESLRDSPAFQQLVRPKD